MSPSAVEEVRINQDPYSARYYSPGRGQMEIITKSAAQHYHGQPTFYFRDSAFNAQNALAPSKPFEQRASTKVASRAQFRMRQHSASSSPSIALKKISTPWSAPRSLPRPRTRPALSAPTCLRPRETPSSARAPRTFQQQAFRLCAIQLPGLERPNQGVGGQTLATAGYNNPFYEHDFVTHVDSTLNANTLNQISAGRRALVQPQPEHH